MTGLVAPPSRNAPCPCGSGRRYKECHGALVAASSVDTVRVLLVTALAAQQDGRLAEAEEYYTRALALDPTNFDALHMLGVTYFQRQEFTRSRELIRAACVLRPDVVEAARNLELVEAALARVAAQARYRSWIATIEKASVAARARLRNAIAGRADAPRLSLVMPAYNSSPRWLAACLDSVFAQTYPHWELCIADDASTDPATRDTLASYAARDSRIRIVWRTVNGHISAASNSALTLATAPYIALLDHDDALPDHALAEVALALVNHPTTSILYTDEDKLDEQGVRFEPYFKPDWNPALASSQNFVSHLGVYRTELVRSVGGFRQGFEGAQDWDLLLRCAERVTPTQIHHVPQVLYHWRTVAGSTARTMASKDYAGAAQERTVRERADRAGSEVAVTRVVYGAFLQADPTVGTLPPVSLVVLHPPSMPSGDAVDRWRPHAGESVVEILPVAAGSEAGRELDDAPLRLERGDAKAINAVVATARGDMLVFVAACAAPADAAWLARLAARALQTDIGCVGSVTFDATRRTARGGYILDRDIVATTAFAREPRGFVGMAGRNQIVQNLSAVCLSGLAVRRVTWEGAQGLDVVHLGSAYHDVDLCLRLAERGLQHVWHPGIVFVDERPLRVRQTSPLDAASDIGDAAYMRVRHRAILERDPAYNPNLSRPPRLFEIPDGDPTNAALSPIPDTR